MKNKKQPSFGLSITPFVFLVVSIAISIFIFDLGEVHIAMFTSGIFASILSIKFLGYKWSELEEGILRGINMTMSALIVMMVIGMIIGTWILSGVVPTMIYYGLQIFSPQLFLLGTCIITCIISIATGSSWTTVATIGIALVGVGAGLGIPLPMTAGAIISGSYFGDKMSPLSDTTNLAPAITGANLFDHIRHMIYTTGPSLIISLILFGILGMKFHVENTDVTLLNTITSSLSETFYISPILLIVPCVVIAMVIIKMPAIPALFIAAILGGAAAMIFQGADLGTVIDVMNNGYSSNIGNEVVDILLSRGGLQSMLWTISLIICAMVFGGVMETTGMLRAISIEILKLAKSTGSLVLATVLSCIAMNIVAGDQYLAIVIPGRMYKDTFQERGLHPKNLSRILEDAGTLTSPLIPWTACGAYMMGTLGIAPWVYVPFCFLNLLNPIISIIYGFTGTTMEKLDVKATEIVEQYN
ncbi:Na+:H+ antiporter, NhaC family [Dethiosulfatibacter aminovorans DSM 17477]|uniref:Na+:H+ antiporter, NhaC family n=1 Tax=Dethiosulfatibacter aminovorans DSM 17477 TaxID=1121476 RepID=A0A1M6N4A6_9FIRM|nr:Na+/H+ antiporter NhaC [Dethiosulfatibacter aminovorans]SHJ90551.1 Na+:H+ antiporter, NhaC family [Dethiosulfatibacter aminovorans DSM 17477]